MAAFRGYGGLTIVFLSVAATTAGFRTMTVLAEDDSTCGLESRQAPNPNPTIPFLGDSDAKSRPWGPEQATGEPNTLQAGDSPTAWASLSPDDDDEWLDLGYDELVEPAAVVIYESFNPGAVRRVGVFDEDDNEINGWSGTVSAHRGDRATTTAHLKVKNVKSRRVRIYLDSKGVKGWNEIDAVGLTDRAGKTQWATSATASSTYADGIVAARQVYKQQASYLERLRRMEDRLERLQKAVEEIRDQLKNDGDDDSGPG